MNNWRPENWKNPWYGREAVSPESADIHYHLQHIFEAGAHAMLEALEKQGPFMTPEQMRLLAPDRKYPYGYLVFIPEEKEVQKGLAIGKAIEVLTCEVHNITLSPDPDVPAALNMGIKALERLRDLHAEAHFVGGPLCGETPWTD